MNKPQLRLPIDEFTPEGAVWRPIHYLGSKLRLVEPLLLAFDQVDPARGRLVDLFSGSGTVSFAAASSRDVTAVDIQEYSRVLCSAVLNPAMIDTLRLHDELRRVAHENIDRASGLIEYEQNCLKVAKREDYEPICELIEFAPMVALESFEAKLTDGFRRAHKRAADGVPVAQESLIVRYFGGLFFSYEQAATIDALLTVAHRQDGRNRDFLLAAIISTASEVVNTVGKHFAQPIRPRAADGKPKRHLISKIIRDRELDVLNLFSVWLERYRSLPTSSRNHRAIRADFADALDDIREAGAVYADPPYTRDHYSRFYHVLETMCLWDNPGISTTRIRSLTDTFSRGMYRADRHQSPFCIRSQAPAAFEKLFSGVKRIRAPLVLSYSPYAGDDAHPRVMGVDQIVSLAGKYFRDVETVSVGKFSHMKLNHSRLHLDASAEAELLFLCR
ncbi:DNA adenine methylase [Bradyrhizobium elkanii]